MNQVIAFARLTKIDEAKRLVFGRAVQEVPDRVGEMFDYASSKSNFQKWSKSQSEASLGKSEGNIRAMHKDVAAGIVVPGGLTFHDDECAIDVCTKITDDQEWEKVTSGTYTGFSIGGRYVKKWEDPSSGKTRYTADPSEISLVDRPCVGTATFFEIQKADGSVLQKAFVLPQSDASKTEGATSAAATPAEGAKLAKVFLATGDKPVGEVDKAELPKVGGEFELGGRTFQLNKVDEAGDAHVDEVYTVAGTPSELGSFAKAVSAAGMSISDVTALVKAQPVIVRITPEIIDAKAREMYKAAGGTDEDPTKLAQFRIEAAKELRKIAERDDTNPDEGKAKYGKVKFADEKNKKYPLDTKAHVKAAASYWGMPKNREKYSEEDQKTIGARIAAAEKEMGIGEESKKAMTPGKLRKNLRTCAQFAMLIDALCEMTECVEFESAQEGDDSPIVAQLYNHIADLGQCLQDMVAEEVKEEVEGTEVDEDEDAPAVAESLLAMGEKVKGLRKHLDAIVGVTPEAVEAKAKELAKGGEVTPELSKAAETELRKVGARNSKADQSRIQAVHDHSVELGATCASAMSTATNRGGTGTNELEQVEPSGALKKIEGENAELRKSIAAQEARLAKLEAQPMPVKGMIKIVAVGKSDESSAQALGLAEQLASTVEPILAKDGSIDPVATAMKMVLAKGGTRITMQKQQ